MKMSYKVNTNLCMALFFFLLVTSTHASRPAPASSLHISNNSQNKIFEEESVNMEESSCEGIAEEDCLMRRTLAAHTDYIYTDKHKP
ncbi:hypothetical protein TanjilG_24780 [Lupinus angustifolius]|uniref:Phytosulfokine n=1 Tax=Lupinus angustifolius TaxID=3871 RepID=A0A4P1RKK8_LUPAN|nr:PREDICTED: phytosulfokines 3 [Lupinus angustifolius]OIW12847.1 hypothetical protein TanjilG_24780 [Lupinus angustifolius]